MKASSVLPREGKRDYTALPLVRLISTWLPPPHPPPLLLRCLAVESRRSDYGDTWGTCCDKQFQTHLSESPLLCGRVLGTVRAVQKTCVRVLGQKFTLFCTGNSKNVGSNGAGWYLFLVRHLKL